MDYCVYDIEQFPNFFCISFCPLFIRDELIEAYTNADLSKDKETKAKLIKEMGIKTFYIYKSINDASVLYNYIRQIKILFGYNNHHYDDLMLDYVCNNRNLKSNYLIPKLYKLSQDIVNYEGSNIRRDFSSVVSEFSNIYKSIDVMRLNYFDKLKISLKKVQVGLKWYRVEDLPKPFDEAVTDEEIYDIVDYNINDVLSTRLLVIKSLPELAIREYTNKKFKFKNKMATNILSSSRSKLANTLISHFYSQYTNLDYQYFAYDRTDRHTIKLSEIIDNNIEFKTIQFKELLLKLKNTKLYVYNNNFTENILVGDNYKLTKYVLKTGGLHTEDRPGIFNADDNYIIRDADVGSYYPRIMINRNVYPAHLDMNAFLKIILMLTESRLKAKAEGNTEEADVYKIVINALYGKLGDEFSFLKDHAALYNVTFNGQLYLLLLAEEFTINNITVISTNTDGIVIRMHKSQEKLYYDICNRWQEKFKFQLEYTDYIKYVRTTVNDYMSIKPGGKIKLKGDFEYNISLEKGYNKPIVSYAIFKYFSEGIPVEETIKSCTDIYDFCLSSKISSDFDTVFVQIKNRVLSEKILSKTTRFYVSSKQSSNSIGGYIFKRYKSKYNKKTISMCKHRKVTIFNDFFKVDKFEDYNIDYSYYISEAYKFIYKVNGQINNVHRPTSTKKRISGTLFDEIDMQEEVNTHSCKTCAFGGEDGNSILCICPDSKHYMTKVKSGCSEWLSGDIYNSNKEEGEDDDDD